MWLRSGQKKKVSKNTSKHVVRRHGDKIEVAKLMHKMSSQQKFETDCRKTTNHFTTTCGDLFASSFLALRCASPEAPDIN